MQLSALCHEPTLAPRAAAGGDALDVVHHGQVSAEQAPELANIVRAWLVGEQIIKQEESDSDLCGPRPASALAHRIYGNRASRGYQAALAQAALAVLRNAAERDLRIVEGVD